MTVFLGLLGCMWKYLFSNRSHMTARQPFHGVQTSSDGSDFLIYDAAQVRLDAIVEVS